MLKNTTRREVLKSAGALVATATFHPVLQAAIGDAKGIDASRVGLVIGNSSYADSPLTNPANDANAIAQSLGILGFKTQLLLNASLNDLSEAVAVYVEQLARQKAVGLFYYAGHGVQLGWRNYIIPIGAKIDRLDDVPKQAYELNIMLGALSKAKNPMNIIILDACRDNPFGKRLLPEQKGLSQFDAPIGSLLSYATSPGNTASDGSGANGLFTENLLREMKVPLARIEDVFKRVRLNVRIKSNGLQIPWESTSLEEDFYFIANEAQFRQAEREVVRARENAEAQAKANAQEQAQAKALTKAETEANDTAKAKALADADTKARLQAQADARESARAEAEIKAQVSLQNQSDDKKIKTELARWEMALASTTATATEDYLRLFPSGLYSQLALARLDALLAKAGEKKLNVQSSVANPYTKGSASGVSTYTIGDQFTYVDQDPYTHVVSKTYTETVTRVSDTQIEFDGGNRIVDMLGNEVTSTGTRFLTPAQFYPNTYALGQSWNTTFGWLKDDLLRHTTMSLNFKIVGRERLVIAAGTFNAFKIEGFGYVVDGPTAEVTYWIDPEKCSCPIVFEMRRRGRRLSSIAAERKELIAFQQRVVG